MGPKRMPSFVTKEISSNPSDNTGFDSPPPNPKGHNRTALLMTELFECRAAVRGLEKGFQRELYDKLQDAFRIAEAFKENENAWIAFCRTPFWERCKTKRPTPTEGHTTRIKWVVRYIFEVVSADSPRYNRAYKYWRTLQGYARDSVPVDEVAKLLALEGAEYAFNNESANHPRRSDSSVSNGGAASGAHASPTAGLQAANARSPNIKDVQPVRRKPTRPVRSKKLENETSAISAGDETYLLIEVSSVDFAAAMNSAVGSRGAVQFRYVEDLSLGWKRLVATSVRISES